MRKDSGYGVFSFVISRGFFANITGVCAYVEDPQLALPPAALGVCLLQLSLEVYVYVCGSHPSHQLDVLLSSCPGCFKGSH